MYSPAYPLRDPLSVGWRLPPRLPLVFRPVGSMVAVFNEEAEDTHLFVPAAAELLRRLAAGETLAGEALAQATAGLDEAGLAPAQLLQELHLLGLAEPFRA